MLYRFSVKLYKVIQPSFLRFLPVCILLVFDESESLLLFDFRCWQNVNWQKLTNTSQNLTRVSFLLFASPGIFRQNSTSHNLTLRWNVSFLSASFNKNWHPLFTAFLPPFLSFSSFLARNFKFAQRNLSTKHLFPLCPGANYSSALLFFTNSSKISSVLSLPFIRQTVSTWARSESFSSGRR